MIRERIANMSSNYIFDSHCHLDYLVRNGQELRVIIDEARRGGVEKMVSIGTRVDSFDEIDKICADYPQVYASVGQHPNHVGEEGFVGEEKLIEIANRDYVVAIGESGLDYFRGVEQKEAQKTSFLGHINVARRTRLPLVIHSRSSSKDMLDMIGSAKSEGEFSAIWHCFDGTEAEAERALSLGMLISFSGMLTYKKRSDLREIAAKLPLESLLVETDSPYLSPEPFRGESNVPLRVVEVVLMLSEVRTESFEELKSALCKNFEKIFFKINSSRSI